MHAHHSSQWKASGKGQMAWCLHTLEHWSASRRKETLTDAVTLMNLEDIMLSELMTKAMKQAHTRTL